VSRRIRLTKGQFAIVDDADFERVACYRWHTLKRGRLFHAMRSEKRCGRKRTIYMHRVLMGDPHGLHVDHRNGNGLDNRRSNLRVATRAQNAINYQRTVDKTSKYRGVSWNPRSNRWRATVTVNCRQHYAGVFTNAADAARAYDRAAIKLHGDFAVTNFPRKEYDHG
jgi:hypothetical protein